MQSLLCDDLETKYSSYNVWTVDTNQYYASLLQHNPYYQSKLREMFDGPDLFGPVFNFFFKPSLKIREQIDSFRKNTLNLPPLFSSEQPLTADSYINQNKDNHIFGLQIRSNDKDSPWAMDSYQQTQFFRCAEAIRSNNFPYNHEITLVVATDGQDVRRRSKEIGLASGMLL